MNKFSKTSYPRHSNYNNLVNPTNQKKQPAFEQSGHKIYEDGYPIQSTVQKKIQKIQIDSNLLFNSKQHPKNNKHIGNQRNNLFQHGYDHLSGNTADQFLKVNKNRPQSKQQSRTKVVQSMSLNKNKQFAGLRPYTSKGQRNIVYHHDSRNKSLADESDHEVEIKRESKTSLGSRKRNNSKQISLQTSIDPQFLALFAS